MLAEMQSAMNNMVNNQLQSEFQMASLTSPTSSSPTLALAPQASQLALAQPLAPPPSPPGPVAVSPPPAPMAQSPLPPVASPPLCPSPGVDTTISAIARAHRETFVYAHDKLGLGMRLHNGGELDNWEANRCSSGYHLNGLNTIYHHDNNVQMHNGHEAQPQNVCHLPPSTINGHHHSFPHQNKGHRLCQNSNLYGSQHGQEHGVAQQGQNCPWKKHKDILLVSE